MSGHVRRVLDPSPDELSSVLGDPEDARLLLSSWSDDQRLFAQARVSAAGIFYLAVSFVENDIVTERAVSTGPVERFVDELFRLAPPGPANPSLVRGEPLALPDLMLLADLHRGGTAEELELACADRDLDQVPAWVAALAYARGGLSMATAVGEEPARSLLDASCTQDGWLVLHRVEDQVEAEPVSADILRERVYEGCLFLLSGSAA